LLQIEYVFFINSEFYVLVYGCWENVKTKRKEKMKEIALKYIFIGY
jgi:hypothetical protein